MRLVYGDRRIIDTRGARSIEELVDLAEAQMIGQLAQKVHLDGRAWAEWPTVESAPVPGKTNHLIDVIITVEADLR